MNSRVLIVLLTLSLALNAWLLWPKPTEHAAEQTAESASSTSKLIEHTQPSASQRNDSYQIQPQTEAYSGHTDSVSLSQVKQWLIQGRYTDVEQYLINELREQPDSSELLLLEADWVLATQPLSSALLHFFALQDSPALSFKQKKALLTRTESLLNNAIEALQNASDWDLLAQLLEPIFQLKSTDEALALILAEAYARQQKYTLMEDALASLPAGHVQATLLRERFAEAEPETEQSQFDEPPFTTTGNSRASRIALVRSGEHYIVNTQLQGVATDLLLDTGASSTAISKAHFRDILRFNSLKRVGLFDVQTAGGTIRAPMFRIDTMQIGNFELKDIGVLVLPGETLGDADGLLGMNVLKQFHFQLDQTTAELVLTPRKN